MKTIPVYLVSKISEPMRIDAGWHKPCWQEIQPIEIVHYMGSLPCFQPKVQAKMIYDPENLFVIFNVKDQFVRCITGKINGPVWEDSCVEFFFAPDTNHPERYFNLEVNCGGTPLMHYNTLPGNQFAILDPDDIREIEIAYTLPQLIDPEIKDPVEWTVEYRIPLSMISKYSPVTNTGPGVEWKANFYKIAENNSNPHYITWSEVINEVPDFHLPQFFGKLRFE
jgi:hypothetical protein